MPHKDVVIIGAGPAGIATALQLKRYHIEATLLEGREVGGLLRSAGLVENYPGFPGGITGPDLAGRFREQMRMAGVEVGFRKVVKLEYRDEGFLLETDHGPMTAALAVIAAGTRPREISLPLAGDDLEEIVFYDVHPLLKMAGKRCIIIGAGDAAFDYALNLSRNNRIVILNRSRRPRCLPVLWDRCRRSEKISYYDRVSIRRIERKGTAVLLDCVPNSEQEALEVEGDCLIVAAGREPCLDFLGDDVKENLPALRETDKLFMVGDVKNDRYRQTAICVGDGVRAAMKIGETIAGGAG